MIVRVGSSSSSGMALTQERREWERRHIVCSRCGRFDRRWYPRPVDVYLLEYEDGPIILTGLRAALPAFRSDFIEQIREFTRDFAFGRCYNSERHLLSRYITLYSPYHVIAHRNETTKYTRCAACGLVTTNVIFPPGYFVRSELPPGPVYQGSAGTLYLDEDLASRVDWSGFPDVQLHRFEVRDTPLPGWHSRDDPEVMEWGAACQEAEKELRQRRDSWLDKWLKPPQV